MTPQTRPFLQAVCVHALPKAYAQTKPSMPCKALAGIGVAVLLATEKELKVLFLKVTFG